MVSRTDGNKKWVKCKEGRNDNNNNNNRDSNEITIMRVTMMIMKTENVLRKPMIIMTE